MISKELEYRFAEFRTDADGIAGDVLPYRIDLKGESMRKKKSGILAGSGESDS